MMAEVCPWWLAYTFDNRLRRWLHDPSRMLSPLVSEGMTVVDIGPGMGHFTIPMARMVGGTGLVIAADLQPKILEVLTKRARKAGVADRIHLHVCQANRVGIEGPMDFVLMANVVHEVPDPPALFSEVYSMLRQGGRCLVIEPVVHVGAARFERTVDSAQAAGLTLEGRPQVRVSRAVLLAKP